MTSSTATPRRLADSSADSIGGESISSFSTTSEWCAESISARSGDIEPGLQTSPSTSGPAATGAPSQSASNTVVIAETAARSWSITAKSRVSASSSVRLPVMIAEASPSAVNVFWWKMTSPEPHLTGTPAAVSRK